MRARNIKTDIQNILAKIFGYKLIGARKTVKHNDFDSIIFFILNNLYKKKDVIIFDIGANKGQSINRFNKVFKNSIFFCFEPTKRLFELLKTKFLKNEKINIYNFGISNKKEKIKFFDYKYSPINSFVPVDKETKFYKSRKKILNSSDDEDFIDSYHVEVNSLDEISKDLNVNDIDILKIDTQGFEDKVLEGCSNLLENKKIKVIELELILGFGYQKNLSFFDLEKTLSKYDYKLIAINHCGNILSFSNYQTDLIYVSDEVYQKIKMLHYKNEAIENVMNKTDKSNPFSY